MLDLYQSRRQDAPTSSCLQAKKIAVCHAADFGQAGGLPAALGAKRYTYPEDAAAVSVP